MATRGRCVAVMVLTSVVFGVARADDAPPLPAATNLDFEGGAAPSGAPVGWTCVDKGYALAVDPEGVHGGKACARVASSAGVPLWQAATVTQTIAAAPYRGKRVRASAFLRMRDVSGYAGLRMRVSAAQKEPLAADRRQDHSWNGTRDWEQQSVVLDVAATAETIEYGIVLGGTGVAWIDDFVVETVGEDVPSTDVMSYGPAPANLDFEGATHPRGMPLHWLGGSAGYDFVYDTDAPHGGKKSGKLVWTRDSAPPAGAWTVCGQTIPAASWRGKRVRFAGWIRTNAAAPDGGGGLWLRADDASDNVVAFDNMSGFEVSGTSGWTRCEIVLDVPQSTHRLAFGMILSGGGAGWCDDLELAEAGPSALCSVDTSMADPPLAESTGKANLDFEGGADTEGRPAGWRGGGRGFTPSVDTKVFHAGKASARVSATELVAAHPQAGTGVVRALPADPYRGKRVRVTGWLRTEKLSLEPEAGAALALVVAGPGKFEVLAMDDMEGRHLHGDCDWTNCAIVLDVADAAKSLVLAIGLQGPGSVWVDDIRIEVVGTDVPCTGKK